MLNTEKNTAAMERRVLRAAKDAARAGEIHAKPRNITTVFEHGQWWIEDRDSGAQWSACDTNRGFCFEQVTDGQEY